MLIHVRFINHGHSATHWLSGVSYDLSYLSLMQDWPTVSQAYVAV